MSRLVVRAAMVAGLLLLFAAAQSGPLTPAQAVVNCTIETSLDSEERAFLTLLNNHRVQNGRAPLGVSYKLSRAASWKSNDLGVNAYFAHDDLNRTWVQRIRDCGYGYNAWLGENIAAGVSSAQGAFDLWKNSPGHNANMLSTNYTAVGIGRAYVAGSPYGWYWTTDFGGVDDGWSLATAAVHDEPPGAGPSAITLWTRARGGGTLDLRAMPHGSGVAVVEFYVDAALVRRDPRAPFAAVWRGSAPMNLSISAYDRSGRHLGSAAITAVRHDAR